MLASIVDTVIDRYTAPGDTVLDPFAGYGTTLDRAVALGREAIGVELLPERVDLIRTRVPQARVTEGDARGLLSVLRESGTLGTGRVSLILSSPPYMTSNDHDADPLTAYEEDGGDYGRYLRELGLVAAQCARMLTSDGHLVWNVGDMHHRGVTTHLIDDAFRVLEEHLQPVTIIPVEWDRYPHDLVADALLVFRRPATGSESPERQ